MEGPISQGQEKAKSPRQWDSQTPTPCSGTTGAPKGQRALPKPLKGEGMCAEPGTPPPQGWGTGYRARAWPVPAFRRPSSTAGAVAGARPAEDVSSAWARASRGAAGGGA